MIAAHPTNPQLYDFLLGRLSDAAQVEVESHFADCDECRDRALYVPANDTLTELLASALTRVESQRSAAPTPTFDGAATPPAFAPTLAWQGNTETIAASNVPPALANHPKYRALRLLGTGGMGSVWLAEHTVMNRQVAVKVIRPDLLARPGAAERFLREVRAAAKLHHPNIVTAFDAEQVGDSCLLVMEYVPGQTLADRLEAGPLPVAEACRAIRDAARGLAVAHKAGLVHRDVKPHNLIRDAEATTKVLDFGLAAVGAGEVIAADDERLTGAGMVVGTPDYIAPEQIADPHGADARADIYGLGCTFYHLLSGRSPLPHGSVTEKLAAQRERPMDPIPELPPAVAVVLAKMTAKNPEERYQSADEVIAALERCLRIVDRRQDRQRVWGLAAGLLAAGLVVFTGLIVAAAVVLIAAIVVKIQRDNQEITIQTDDPDIEVVMKRKGEVLRIVDKKSGKFWDIDTTKNDMAQADSPDGLTVKLPDSEPFVLRRNGKDVFKITRIPRPIPPPESKPDVPRKGYTGLGQKINAQSRVENLIFGPDGKTLLVAASGYFRVFNPVTGKQLFSDDLHWAGPMSLAISKDGRTAALGMANKVFLYDLAVRKRVAEVPARTDGDKSDLVISVSLTPDGQTLAYVVGSEVVYYDRATEKVEHTRSDDDNFRPFAVRYSPDGRRLVVASYLDLDKKTRISVLNAKTRELEARRELTGSFWRVTISADSKQVFASGTTIGGRTFVVLGLPKCEEIERDTDLPGGGVGGLPVPSPDGKVLAIPLNNGAVQLYYRVKKQVAKSRDPIPNTRKEPFKGPGDRMLNRAIVAFAPDGHTVAIGSGAEIAVWSLDAEAPTPEQTILEDIERRVDPANTDGKSLPFALMEGNGVAAIRFGKWLVVFEGVTCDARGKVLFGVGAFFLPGSGNRGNFADPGLKRPAPALRQQSTAHGNMIGIAQYEFKLENKGGRLVFSDHSYDATEKVQTIVVARDGTTRLVAPSPKK